MFGFHEKRRLKNILYSKAILLLLVIVMVYLAYSVLSVYQKERGTQVKKEKQEAQLKELQERERVLREEIERLSTEHGVEEEIRSKFELGKEGEKVIVIVESREENIAPPAEESKGFWGRLLNIF